MVNVSMVEMKSDSYIDLKLYGNICFLMLHSLVKDCVLGVLPSDTGQPC